MKFLWPSQNIPTLRKSQYVLLFDIQITQETQHTKSLSIIFLYFWITLFAITDRMLYKLHRKKGCNLAALVVGCFANCIINYCVVCTAKGPSVSCCVESSVSENYGEKNELLSGI